MTHLRRVFTALVSVVLLAGPAFGYQPPPGQTEYVPATPGTATEQLPAAPLLIAAYVFVWVATIVYVWTVWRRLNRVEAEMRALESKTKTADR